MEYMMTCDDGFKVQSSSKEEVANMMAMHIMTMHPKEKISMIDMMKMVKSA